MAAATPVMLNRDRNGLYAMALIIILEGFDAFTMLWNALRMVGTIACPATEAQAWVQRVGSEPVRRDSLFPMPDTLGSVKTLYSCQFARALACARKVGGSVSANVALWMLLTFM